MAYLAIITPTYNAGKYIAECIESVQSQTSKNFDHFIMDGNSTDNTISLVNNYLNQGSHLKLFTEKDSGVFDAMNKGIQSSSSEWLYFLGADDRLYDEKVLENITEYLARCRADIVYGDVYFEQMKRIYDGPFDIEKILKRNICHQAVFYRRSVFEKVGYYNKNYRSNADYDLNLRCWLGGKIRHQYIQQTVAFYADGGLSSAQPDLLLQKDFPAITTDALINGNWTWNLKVIYLSKIYRKLFLRYSLRMTMSKIIAQGFFIYRFPALILMILSLPFYLVKSKNSREFNSGISI
jgi:glycosyltransferase involved in cell wall biosynthesis